MRVETVPMQKDGFFLVTLPQSYIKLIYKKAIQVICEFTIK